MRLPTVFGMCQCVEIGVKEEEKEKRQIIDKDPLDWGVAAW